MPLFGVILVPIFPHSDWIRRDTRKIKSKFTLQDNKKLYPSKSNAFKIYGNAKLHKLPALGTVDCFFYLGSLFPAFIIHRTVAEGEATSITPLYHFYLFHRHLEVGQTITAESSHIRIVESGSIGFTNH